MIGLLNKTVTYTPQSYSQDGNGHVLRTAGETTAALCALQTLSADERERWQANTSEEVMALYVVTGSGLEAKDTVTVDSNDYEVKSPAEDMGGRGRYDKFIVKRVLP